MAAAARLVPIVLESGDVAQREDSAASGIRALALVIDDSFALTLGLVLAILVTFGVLVSLNV